QAHGVRPLQRIDPFSEHTKMLATLTREQEAMGRPVARVERPSRAVTELKPTPEAVEIKNPEQFALPLDAAEEPSVSAQTSPGLPETFQETTTSQVSVAGEPHFEAESTETSLSELPTTAPASAAAEISASTEASLSIEEMEMENDLMAGLDIQEDNEHQTPSLQKSSDTQKSESSDSADLNALLEGGESISDANVSLPMNLQESISSETSLDLSPTESGLEDLLATSNNELSPSGSALSMLALSTQTNTLPASEVASQASKTGDGLDGFNVNLLDGATNDLSGAFAEASDFANVADQPETNLLAADVLALLQTNQADERIEVRSNDKKILQEKSVKIDENLLDSVSEAIDESAGTTVFLRKEGMKPYRRNNAKYSCSACSSDFFTKEQVDACFYSHPEEGSEEAKALLAKVKNSPKKSVA
ncbi:MAG: hypothetical protein RI953_1025, partial [Pseudomonadota bacterium]